MTRSQHDRLNDHFGEDLDTDSVLSADLPTPVLTAAGQTIRQALLDIIARGTAGAGALIDLLTGDNRDFTTTIGSWAASGSGSTITHDGAVGINGNGSAKLHTTNGSTDRYGTVSIPGTFKAGQLYHARVLLRHQALTTTDYVQYQALLGDVGAADTSTPADLRFGGPTFTDWGMPSDRTVAFLVAWTPSADRTNVVLRITRTLDLNLSKDLWIEEARVVAVPGNSVGLAGPVLTGAENGLPTLAVVPQSDGRTGIGALDRNGYRFGFLLSQYSAGFSGPEDGDGNNAWLAAFQGSGLAGYGNQPSGAARRGFGGFNIELGPDYVGFYAIERSAGEIEFHTDGAVDVIFVDGNDDSDTTHHTKFENAAGTASAIPSMGMLPQFSSAPGSPVEGQSYYDTVLHKARTFDGTVWQNWW